MPLLEGLGFLTVICHLRVAFASSEKSKCHSRRPLLLFLDSENGICFFWKKQMPPLEAFAWVFGLLSVIWEWHLLFPKEANATPGGLCLGFLTVICHLRMAFAFSKRSKCHSWRPLLGFLDCYLSSEIGICFFRKKQMPLLEAFSFVFGLWKSKCLHFNGSILFSM